MGKRKKSRVPRAHGIAHDVGALEAEMLDQAANVLGHDRGMISGGVVELARLTVAAIVERDDTPPGARQRRHPAGRDPVHFLVRREAVDEYDRLALPLVKKRNLHTVTDKARHRPRRAPYLPVRSVSGAAIPFNRPAAKHGGSAPDRLGFGSKLKWREDDDAQA